MPSWARELVITYPREQVNVLDDEDGETKRRVGVQCIVSHFITLHYVALYEYGHGLSCSTVDIQKERKPGDGVHFSWFVDMALAYRVAFILSRNIALVFLRLIMAV